MRLPLLAALGLAAFACSAGPALAADGPLCGITYPVDVLLRCKDGASAPPPTGQPTTSLAAAATAASAHGEQVRRVSLVPRFVDDTLMVRFAAGTPSSRQREVLDDAGATVIRRIDAIDTVVVRVEPARRDRALAALQSSPLVSSAERDAVIEALATTPNDSVWPTQWGPRTVRLPEAWDRTQGSSSVIVAVLDTGVDASHPDLAGAVLPGFDLLNGDNDASDDHGHGTAVAGVIAARTNNRQGVAGTCWSCSILPVKVLAPDGTGDMALAAAGVVRAVDAGAHVINVSLGGPGSSQAMTDAVGYAASHGVVVVAAAGNNGVTQPFYPAATPGAVSVSATDDRDRLYDWSNYGQWSALAAPGCNETTTRGGGYGTFCGTSSATPVVAGLVALARSLLPSVTRDQIIGALEQTTIPVGDRVRRGRVDAAAILAGLPQSAPVPPTPADTTTVTLKGRLTPTSRTYRRPVGAGELAASITFTGSPTLRLTVRDQEGAVLADRTARSPLHLETGVKAGAVSIELRGKARAAFTLELAHPVATVTAAGSGPPVLLSPIASLPGPAAGPALAAPTGTATIALGFGLTEQPLLSASLVEAVNHVRRAHGLKPVRSATTLARAAVAHVRGLAATGRFTHDWGDGTPFARWILRFYPTPRAGTWIAGENLLWSPTPITADDAVVAWLDSPEHRRILLTPTWRELGIGIVAVQEAPGVYGGGNVVIAAADFGAISGS